jgi:hypothetical protein
MPLNDAIYERNQLVSAYDQGGLGVQKKLFHLGEGSLSI